MESSEHVIPSDSERSEQVGESESEFDPSDEEMAALADAAFRQAAIKLVRQAKQTGQPLTLWDQGQVRAVPPDQLPDLESEPIGEKGSVR